MKKTIITMLIALVAICASAETYSYLKFTLGRRPQDHLR